MSPKYCMECGEPLVEGKKFCGECGAEVGTARTSGRQPPAPAPSSVDNGLIVAVAVAIVGGLLMIAGYFALPAFHVGSEAVALANLERATYLLDPSGDASFTQTLSSIFGIAALVVVGGALALFSGARKLGIVLCGLGLTPLILLGFQFLRMSGVSSDGSVTLGSAFAATIVGAIALTFGGLLSPKR